MSTIQEKIDKLRRAYDAIGAAMALVEDQDELSAPDFMNAAYDLRHSVNVRICALYAEKEKK